MCTVNIRTQWNKKKKTSGNILNRLKKILFSIIRILLLQKRVLALNCNRTRLFGRAI